MLAQGWCVCKLGWGFCMEGQWRPHGLRLHTQGSVRQAQFWPDRLSTLGGSSAAPLRSRRPHRAAPQQFPSRVRRARQAWAPCCQAGRRASSACPAQSAGAARQTWRLGPPHPRRPQRRPLPLPSGGCCAAAAHPPQHLQHWKDGGHAWSQPGHSIKCFVPGTACMARPSWRQRQGQAKGAAANQRPSPTPQPGPTWHNPLAGVGVPHHQHLLALHQPAVMRAACRAALSGRQAGGAERALG